MNKALLLIISLLSAVSVTAQYDLNSFVRNNPIKTRYYDRSSTSSFYPQERMSFSSSASTLTIEYENGSDKYSSVITITLNYKDVSIYTGRWEQRYNGRWDHVGDRSVVTFYCTQKDIRANRFWRYNNQNTTQYANYFEIQFLNERAAEDFLAIIKRYQKPYRPCEKWEHDESAESSELSLENLYNQLLSDLSNLTIYSQQTDHVKYSVDASTKNFSISYVHPNLIIEYNDVFTNTISGSGITGPGKRKVYIDLSDAEFFFSSYWLTISSRSGIEIEYKNSKNLEREILFHASERDCEKICTELRQLQKKISDEHFTGTLKPKSQSSKPKSKQQNNTQSKTISNKYQQ